MLKGSTLKATQRVFDEALKHIRKQRRPSLDSHESCVYRGPHGLGCAFAPAIKSYDPDMEGDSAIRVLDSYNENLHPWAREADRDACNDIQLAHDRSPRYDDAIFMENFELLMRETADTYGLVYTEAA